MTSARLDRSSLTKRKLQILHIINKGLGIALHKIPTDIILSMTVALLGNHQEIYSYDLWYGTQQGII